MTILEKITASMELTELKKFKFQKSILGLMLEWKHLEEYMDSTQHSFQECLDQLHHKEKHLNSVQESAVESNKELESVRTSIQERMKQLGDKERQFNEQVSDLGLKEKRLVLIENSIEERIKEVELREEKLSELGLKEKRLVLIENLIEERIKEVELREEKLKGIFEEVKAEEKRLEGIRESVGERMEVINSREVKLEEKEKEFSAFSEIKVNELDLKEKRLVLITKSVEERFEQVELREEEVNFMLEEFEDEKKQFEKIRESVMEKIDDFNYKQMELDERSQELDKVRDCIERQVKELDFKEKEIEKCLKELESKENEQRETELMGKKLSDVDFTKVGTEYELEDIPTNSPTDTKFCDKVDGKGLQLFLNRREKDHKSKAEEVYQLLQSSSDPAKLVLDAMEGFYPTNPNKGKRDFKLGVIRKSCVLLLEQLLRISPKVRPNVKMEAMELICQWKAKLSRGPGFMEVLGHLYLLVSYCLPIPYYTNEILGLVEIVAEHRGAPELCRLLGLTDRIPDLIRMVKKNHILLAVRFISEFGLRDEFPPALLLNDYMKHVRQISKQMRRKNKSCKKHQNEVRKWTVAAMREAIRCIKDHKLESDYSPKGIEKSIEMILMHNGKYEGTAPSTPNNPVRQQKSKKTSMSSINSPIIPSNLPSMAPSSSKSGPSKLSPVTNILANMDGRRLQFFLNENSKDHEIMRNEVLLALEHSFDPARLVLEAMQGFYPLNGKVRDERFEASVIRSSCILMLEQLMRLKKDVQPQVKGEAMVIARQWKLKMREEIENPQVILGFLQLMVAFQLTSNIDNDELLCLMEKIAPHPHTNELCEVVGLSKKKPGCVLHPCVESNGSSLENAPFNTPVVFVDVNPADDSNCLGVSMEQRSEVHISHYVSDPAKLVLDAIRACYYSNLEKGVEFSKSKIMDKVYSLLEKLTQGSPEINPRVQQEAMAFSVDWKSNLSVSKENQVEVKAFLHLLATYKLDSSVMFEVLDGLLKAVSAYKQKFELLRLLNFTHKTPDYVQYLIDKDERLLAIRYIYTFELIDKFPPVPILKSHLRYIEKLCTKICEDGNYSYESLDKAADREVGMLWAVIKCISIHKIKFESLDIRINRIKKQKEDRKVLVLLPTGGGSMAQRQEEQLNMKKRAVDLEVQTQQRNATKRQRRMTPVTTPRSAGPMAVHEAYPPVKPTQAPQNAGPMALHETYPAADPTKAPQFVGPMAYPAVNSTQTPHNAGPMAYNPTQAPQNARPTAYRPSVNPTEAPQNAGAMALHEANPANPTKAPQNAGLMAYSAVNSTQVPHNAGPMAYNPTQAPQNVGPMAYRPSVNPTEAPQNVGPMAYPPFVNPTEAPQNPVNLPLGQGRPYLDWQYGHGGGGGGGAMAPSGWQYGPNAGAASYYGVAPPNVIPRPLAPQPTPSYLYCPWQHP